MCASGRHFAVVVFAFIFYNSIFPQGTFLASASSFQETEGQEIVADLELDFLYEVGKATTASNSSDSHASRFQVTQPSVCYGKHGLDVSLPSGRTEERTEQELLQWLRKPLYQGAMVSECENKNPLSQQTEAGKETDEQDTRSGRGAQPTTTIWCRGSTRFSGSMGGIDTDQNSVSALALSCKSAGASRSTSCSRGENSESSSEGPASISETDPGG